MLSRCIRVNFSNISKDLNSRIVEVAKRMEKVLPSTFYEDTPLNVPDASRPKSWTKN